VVPASGVRASPPCTQVNVKGRISHGEKAERQDGHGTKRQRGEKIDIEAILRARMADFSPSEQNLAAHLLDNVHMLPFETGSSIAQAVGVSEMTVTRFVRGLGFESLRDLKNRLRHSVAEKDSDIDDYRAASRYATAGNRRCRKVCAWISTPSLRPTR
jgi:DNA-binding MurR/RpiR family transcriptional regulator